VDDILRSVNPLPVGDLQHLGRRPRGKKLRGTRRCGKCSAAAPSRKAAQNLTKVGAEIHSTIEPPKIVIVCDFV
jgi:hypothetical protein